MSDRFSSVSQTTTDVTDRQTLLRERHKAYALEQYAAERKPDAGQKRRN